MSNFSAPIVMILLIREIFGHAGNTGKYRRIQGNTGEYRGIQGNTGEYREIQGNTVE